MKCFVILVLMMVFTGSAFGQENANAADSEGEAAEVAYTPIALEEENSAGGRNMSDIRHKVNDIKAVVQTDYEVLLATDPEAGGTITISFSITPEGNVNEASVDCLEELSSLQEDIITALEELDFGPAPDQTEDIPVTIPFTLTPPQ